MSHLKVMVYVLRQVVSTDWRSL